MINKVYLIQANWHEGDYPFGYDCNHGMVVVAKNSKEARRLAFKKAEFGDEPQEAWLDSKLTTCKSISLDKKQVLLVDYHAG